MSSRCCRSRNGREEETNNSRIQNQEQEQETEQESRVILRGIGNNDVNIAIDNVSVAVAVLATFGLLTGTLDGDALRSYLDRLIARE